MSAYRVPLLGVVVALGLALLWWLLLYRPAADRQLGIEADVANLQQQQSVLRGQVAALREIEADEVEIREALARLAEFVPPGPSQPAAIRQLQRAADAAGVEIVSVTFGEPAVPAPAPETAPVETGEPGTTLATVSLAMVVDGGYFQIVDLLRRLEVEVPRAVLIESLNLAESGAEGFPTLTASIAAELFAIVPIDDIDELEAGGAAPGATPTPTPSPGASPGPAATPAPATGAPGGDST